MCNQVKLFQIFRKQITEDKISEANHVSTIHLPGSAITTTEDDVTICKSVVDFKLQTSGEDDMLWAVMRGCEDETVLSVCNVEVKDSWQDVFVDAAPNQKVYFLFVDLKKYVYKLQNWVLDWGVIINFIHRLGFD